MQAGQFETTIFKTSTVNVSFDVQPSYRNEMKSMREEAWRRISTPTGA